MRHLESPCKLMTALAMSFVCSSCHKMFADHVRQAEFVSQFADRADLTVRLWSDVMFKGNDSSALVA